jgi:uncharacterized protein (DUF849 family)
MALNAMRASVSVPIGVSTGAWFLPDPTDRLRTISAWEVLPDFASVNFHEAGAVDVARLLLDRGIGVEAGLWNEEAARVLMASDLGPRCLRLLLEPMEHSVDDALANVEAIEQVTKDVPRNVPRLLHGFGHTAWPVLEEAVRRGHQARIWFEDTLVDPNGDEVPGNAALVKIAHDIAQGVDPPRSR